MLLMMMTIMSVVVVVDLGLVVVAMSMVTAADMAVWLWW